MNAIVAIGGAAALLLLALVRHSSAAEAPSERVPLTPDRARALFPRATVYDAIRAMLRQYPSIPTWFAFAMADKESGFDPGAHAGGREDSLGIYQVNWNAHKGPLTAAGIPKDQLYDPRLNALYWGGLASRLGAEALSHGFSADSAARWKAVRLKLKGGFAWDEMGSARAAIAIAPFDPYARKWMANLGLTSPRSAA
jgi:hypothetical protein